MIKPKKGLYYALISTFIALWLIVAFVSTLHAITFFQLTNAIGLAVLLGLAFEIGQATVLFSILMSDNRSKFLPWIMMLFLTALQVTANVYASFRYMDISGTNEWTYWQRAILFSVQSDTPEMYKVIISWISGALLPLIALGMTSLVAQNINIMKEEKEKSQLNDEKINISKEDLSVIENFLKNKTPKEKDEIINEIKEEIISEEDDNIDKKKTTTVISSDNNSEEIELLDETSLTDLLKLHPELENDINNANDQLSNIKKDEKETPKLVGIDSAWENIDKKEIEEPKTIINHTNGLVNITTENVGFGDPPGTIGEGTSGSVEISPESQKVLAEEERLERLREIARENLKKK